MGAVLLEQMNMTSFLFFRARAFSLQISLQLIEENETYQDLMVFFKDATITWNSTTGIVSERVTISCALLACV